ncbi:hypothetical protein F9U42_11350 [Pectobacterium versatile]|uniref:hypothetical protein n=1 Tax=Pectobacterium versatile TaxID=2488639 RepID=UPI001B3930D5|nr:hypothetical protein [Pectobacterium versatile]MBQ4767727.1 hypothetical protein [Pectobacterium versatile]
MNADIPHRRNAQESMILHSSGWSADRSLDLPATLGMAIQTQLRWLKDLLARKLTSAKIHIVPERVKGTQREKQKLERKNAFLVSAKLNVSE